jgi:hypothetical protein
MSRFERFARIVGPVPAEDREQLFNSWVMASVRTSAPIRRLCQQIMRETEERWLRAHASLLEPKADGTLSIVWVPRG